MQKLISNLAMLGLAFTGSIAFCGETYESEEAKFKVTFPAEYEVEKTVDEDGTTNFSMSCTYGDMAILGNAYIYTEAFSEEDNLYSELEALYRVCEGFGSKFNDKKISAWTVGEDMGVSTPLKTGKKNKKETKDVAGYVGSYYVIIRGAFQYQFVILGSKKTYDFGVESRFINSFEILP